MNLGALGVWSGELRFKRDRAPIADAAAELEELGYGTLWLPGGTGTGQPIFDVAAELLAATSTVAVATGIVSIWVVGAEEAAEGQAALRESHPGRFVLGLGVSHAKFISDEDRELLSKPRTAMARYLDRLDAAAGADVSGERILAALGPRMLELARDRSLGSHPYNVTPAHTAAAREALGAGPLLAPEQAVVLETDPGRAREIAREFLTTYLELPNYTDNMLRHGLEEADLRDGGSDRLVDAIVAWGDEDAIAARVQEHRDAGADHVCVQVLSGRKGELPLPEWRRLAAALAA
ncbi:MAG: class F420-dependent oxidoreductase [Solirubrobacterales bacterium]|nr:class F420-dependent oxidoreductase [Solirubrobacterales bacterium]